MAIKILTAKQFESKLANVIKTRDRLKADIHSLCVYALVHAIEHGNPTPINKVGDATDGITHNNAVRRWFNKNGSGLVKWDNDKSAFVVDKEKRTALVSDPEKCSAKIEDITNADPYYTLTKLASKDPDFILLNKLTAMVKQADTRKDSDKRKESDDFAGLEELRALVQRLSKGSNIVEGGAIDITPTKRKAIAANVTSH